MTIETPKIDPLTAFASENRTAFAGLLLFFAVLFAGLGIYGFNKGLPAIRGDIAKVDEEKKPPEDAAKKPEKVNGWEYICAGVAGAVAGLVLVGIGFAQLVGYPKPTIEERHSDARTAILIAGGAVGLCLMLFGAALFICRVEALMDWLSLGKSKQMMPVLTAIAVSLVGAVIAFLSVAPARAEERSNPMLRRLVYGTNAALILLVLLCGLVGLNVLVAVKFPGKLDTTESGFYTLDPKTKEYLLGLDQKVIAYTTLPSSAEGNGYSVNPALLRSIPDARRLLEECAAVNPLKVTVRPLSSVSDQKEINALANRYPSMPLKEDLGILLVLGDDESRASFLSLSDLTRQVGRDKWVFEGEGRLIRDLLFLADNKAKTVVYVTQGTGELSLAPARRRGERSMMAMAEKLSQINCDLRPLVIDPKSPDVPADASFVIVADPVVPLPKETVAALTRFANPADAASKKGKLLVLAGANPASDGKGLSATGLEELLAGWNVVLSTEQIYTEPSANSAGTIRFPEVEANVESKVAVAKDLVGKPMHFPLTRMVSAAPVPKTGVRVEPIFSTRIGRRTFLDGPDARAALMTYSEMSGNTALQTAKKFGTESRPVALAVEDGKTIRAIIVGSGFLFSDEWLSIQQGNSHAVDLFAGFIDTLRERPAVASLATKQYGTYTPPSEDQFTRMFWLPVLLVPLVVAAAGVGVWVVRRK